eukprot:CAMPEP_0116917098 /NCGR_PEP_ID=MMETSP0467-20121206/18937_1 /TAXON_ID=283647 /ORGANISM="Mesodinium pulex, Strain SPMC105" /LENGTH=117 /DNA_ID=CAMNT_0004594119 /DNA_START=1279 /DNA_END=1632 /DNA_ORIENTATION=-
MIKNSVFRDSIPCDDVDLIQCVQQVVLDYFAVYSVAKSPNDAFQFAVGHAHVVDEHLLPQSIKGDLALVLDVHSLEYVVGVEIDSLLQLFERTHTIHGANQFVPQQRLQFDFGRLIV